MFEESDLYKRGETSSSLHPTPTTTSTTNTRRRGGLRSVGCSKLGEEARSKARTAAKAYLNTFSGYKTKIEYWCFKCTQDASDKHKVHVSIIPMEAQGVVYKGLRPHGTSIEVSSIGATAAHHTHTTHTVHATHPPTATTTTTTTTRPSPAGNLNRRTPEPEPEVYDLHDFIKRDSVSTSSHTQTFTSTASTPTQTRAAHQRNGGLRSVGCIKLGQETVSKAREEARHYITSYTHNRGKIQYWRYVCKPDATNKHTVHVSIIPMQSKGIPLVGGVPKSTILHTTSVAAAASSSGTATATGTSTHATASAKSS